MYDDDGSGDVLFLHSFAIRPDRPDSDLGLLREEDEHLVGGIVVVSHEYDEVASRRPSLAGLVAERHLELVECLVQLVLSHL